MKHDNQKSLASATKAQATPASCFGSKARLFFGAGFVLLAFLLLTGCAGIPTTLKPEQTARVNRTHVRAYLPQSELKAEFLMSGYGAGGGLIGAIIDAAVTSGRRHSAEERVQRLREQIRDVDVRGMYWQALSNEVREVSWLKVDQFETIPANVRPLTANELSGGAAVNVGTDYYISQDCRVLALTTGLGFFAQGKHRRPAAAVFAAYHSSEIGKPDGEEAIKLWAADGAAPLRKAITEAVQGNAKVVRHALELMGNSSAAPQRPAKVKAKFVHARGDFGIQMGKAGLKVMVLEDTPDRLIFRTPYGGLFSFPRQEVEVKYLGPK